MKLSNIKDDDIEVISTPKLSDFSPDEIEVIPSQPEMSTPEALARGAVQGATLDFGDEIYGALKSPMGAIKEAGKYVGIQPDRTSEEVKAYLMNRDAVRAKNSQAAKESPWAYYGGNLGTGLALPMGGLMKGANMGVRAGKMALMGGAAGLGSSNEQDVAQQAKDVGTGAAIGGVMGPVAETIAAKFNPSNLKKSAEGWAVKHLRPTPRVARALGPEKLSDVGREALDSGAIGFYSKADETAAKLDDLLSEVGQVKGDIVEAAQAGVDPSQIASRIQNEVINPMMKTAEGQSHANQIKNKLEEFMQFYASDPTASNTISAQQLDAEKSAVQKGINWMTDPKPKAEGMRDYSRILKEEGEKLVSDPAFIDSKRAYGNLKAAQGMADQTAGLSNGGTGLMGNLYDMQALDIAAKGAMTGNPVALAAPVARSFGKGRMASSMAVGADWASKNIERLSKIPGAERFANVLQKASQRGPGAVSATHWLLQQNSPEYLKIMEDASE